MKDFIKQCIITICTMNGLNFCEDLFTESTFSYQSEFAKQVGISFAIYRHFDADTNRAGLAIFLNQPQNNEDICKHFRYIFTEDYDLMLKKIVKIIRQLDMMLYEFIIDNGLFKFDTWSYNLKDVAFDNIMSLDEHVFRFYCDSADFLIKKHNYRYFEKLIEHVHPTVNKTLFSYLMEYAQMDDDVERTAYLMNLKHELFPEPESDEMML